MRYLTRGSGHTFYFTPDKAVFDFQRGDRGLALELRFRGANPDPQIVGERRTEGRVNYFQGSERHVGLATYEQIRYRDLWPGIDMVFRNRGGQLKYEFLLRAGADPGRISLAYRGADSVALAGSGALAIRTPLGTLRDAPPTARQGNNAIPARYEVAGPSYGFALGSYDRTQPMLLDPGLAYSTFLGGVEADDPGLGIAVDASGSAYVTGYTSSASFPTTPGAYDQTAGLDHDAYVTKFAPNGSSLVYSTVIGGSDDGPNDCGATDRARGIAVDSSGNAFIMGQASSSDFPTTPGAFDTTLATSCDTAFVTKLNPAGNALVYSTFVGGADTTSGAIAIDGSGNAFISGGTFDVSYPTTPGALDSTHSGVRDVYHSKLNATGSALVYSTFLGSGASDGLAVDSAGLAYVEAYGSGFPTTPGAFDTTANGGLESAVMKVNTTGTALVYGTYIGGSLNEQALDVDVDGAGSAYVTGYTESPTFPTTPGAYDPTHNGSNDAFVTKLNPSGSALAYSTFVGGSAPDIARGIDVDSNGGAYITGFTQSPQFPTTPPDAFDHIYDGGDMDAFVTRLSPNGASLAYSSFLGGQARDAGWDIAADDSDNAYATGETFSGDFPTNPGAFDTTYNGSRDAFVTKLNTTPYTGYARPKGAAQARFALVTAYEQCTDPDQIHGPPLAYGSCGAPQVISDYLTVGTGDSNGLPTRNEGHVVFRVKLGNPATPADEADVRLELFSNDVYTKALNDYTGELRAQFTLRITDRDNTATGGGTAGPGTTIDVPMGATFGCTPTVDPQMGSSCSATTTVEAITPGAVSERKRSVWQLDRVRVSDGGADGNADTAGDNTLFATAGLFVP